jgi:hypothetical protein
VSEPEFFWQFCDPDAEPGTTFQEGHGYGELARALREFIAVEDEHTPKGFISSGNVALYWSRRSLPPTKGTAASA